MKVPKTAMRIATAMMTAEAMPAGPVARSMAQDPAAPGRAGAGPRQPAASGAATLTVPPLTGPASLGPAP